MSFLDADYADHRARQISTPARSEKERETVRFESALIQ